MTFSSGQTASTLHLTFPDGNKKEFEKGVTGSEIARSISGRLGREALSITLNQTVLDLNRPILESGEIKINTWEDEDGKMAFWHSSAHILAEAVEALYPGVKLGIGPPIEQGFYYDIDFGDKVIGNDALPAIEEKMMQLAQQKNTFNRLEINKKDAIDHYQTKSDPYKLELLDGLEEGTISFYKQGNFTDLCRGPHIPHTGYVKALKLLNTAGAYWRGDHKKKQLTRIYGISFPKKKLLDQYLEQLEEAKKRDHKILGPKLGIYMLDRMVGSGLPMWLPGGTILRRNLEAFLREEQVRRGYQEVITPHIGNLELYRTSGHYPYYKDSQFAPMQVDEEGYLLKPMNCPHHHRIYSHKMRSYRDLPIRLAEFGTVYRYEQTGELNGLSRVRGFTQDDAHIYCSNDQLKSEIIHCIELTQLVFSTFNMPVDIRLSFRDENEEKYGGEHFLWEQAQKDIKEAADEIGLNYSVAIGEASFYGPKIDFIIHDALRRKWQLGTVQVDYVMPERFDLTYIGADNKKHRPVIIHRAPFGSMERFTSILIEHFAGVFPLWLSPVQAIIIPVSDLYSDIAKSYEQQLFDSGIRVKTDLRGEQIGAKIRNAETKKIPYMLIVGEKEKENHTVSVRKHKTGDIGSFIFSDFLSIIKKEIEEKRLPDEGI